MSQIGALSRKTRVILDPHSFRYNLVRNVKPIHVEKEWVAGPVMVTVQIRDVHFNLQIRASGRNQDDVCQLVKKDFRMELMVRPFTLLPRPLMSLELVTAGVGPLVKLDPFHQIHLGKVEIDLHVFVVMTRVDDKGLGVRGLELVGEVWGGDGAIAVSSLAVRLGPTVQGPTLLRGHGDYRKEDQLKELEKENVDK